jgi:ribonucleoside-diphosphate reductase beta chain
VEIETTAAKHEFFTKYTMNDDARSRAFFLARNGVLGEGLSLYGLFTILMNAQRFGHMRNLGQIVTWSARDESLHVEANLCTFYTELKENPELANDPEFFESLRQMIKDVVTMEIAFIKEALSKGTLPDLTFEQLEQFIYFLADFRAGQLGLEPIYGVSENPLEWMDWVFSNNELANFFETRATGYGGGQLEGNWEYPDTDWFLDGVAHIVKPVADITA